MTVQDILQDVLCKYIDEFFNKDFKINPFTPNLIYVQTY